MYLQILLKLLDKIIVDILSNSYQGLLSSGFILSIFLMTNGVNAILGGFEMSEHITLTRGYFKQYLISLAIIIDSLTTFINNCCCYNCF